MSNRWCMLLLCKAVCSLSCMFGGMKIFNADTDIIFVVPVRVAQRTKYKKLYSKIDDMNATSVKMYPIFPNTSVVIPSDMESGTLLYDRVLWVSNNLLKLFLSFDKGSMQSPFVNALYLGSRQQGTKYIAGKRASAQSVPVFSFYNDVESARGASGLAYNLPPATIYPTQLPGPISYGATYDLRDTLSIEFKKMAAQWKKDMKANGIKQSYP